MCKITKDMEEYSLIE